jgi:hypothetical protein
VIIEIAWHQKTGIDFEVQFISEEEWKKELEVLFHLLTDVVSMSENEAEGGEGLEGNLDSDALLAWHKVCHPSSCLTYFLANQVIR